MLVSKGLLEQRSRQMRESEYEAPREVSKHPGPINLPWECLKEADVGGEETVTLKGVHFPLIGTCDTITWV